MAIYRSIRELPTKFLRDIISAAGQFLKDWPFEELRMDSKGECAITFRGEMPEDAISALLVNLDPNLEEIEIPVEYNRDYDYIDGNTLVYTKDGYDYRTLSR